MTSKIDGRNYFYVRGSDVDRDGMYLELFHGDAKFPGQEPLAEIFYSDKGGSMVVTTFSEAVPLEAVEWLIAEAKTQLPPMAN